MTGCDRRGVLSRSGTAQSDRDPVERDPGYFQLDERDSADLILFARRFARHIKYYDPMNAAAGDWSDWFDQDISAILASLAKLPVDPFRAAMQDFRAFLEDDPNRAEAELQSHFGALLQMPLALFREMAGRQAVLSGDDPLWPMLQQIVLTEMATPLAELSAYHKGAEAEGLISAAALNSANFNLSQTPGPGPRLTDQVAGILLTDAPFAAMDLPARPLLGFAPTGWADFYDLQTANTAPFADATDTYERIYDALNHNLLVSTIERLFRAMVRVKTQADARLVQSFEEFAAHTPHYALWLAFLSIFDKAREELNDFTGRHLDFYFEDILRLARRGPVADHVHVTFELSKGRDAHLVPQGTRLRADKDALGQEVVYQTDEDIVVNRATVAEVRAVRIDTWENLGQTHATVRAAPVAASLGGLGEEDLPEEAPHFPPFGPATAPFGRMGFAVVDRQLFLREGTRVITMTIKLDQPLTGGNTGLEGLMVRLTAEEDWFEVAANDSRIFAAVDGASVTLTLTLQGDVPPIVPHDPEIHAGPYPAGIPVMEILFDFDRATNAAARSFARLRDAATDSIEVKTKASGLRLMSIRTPDGTADPADSFTPFGVRPRIGARWIIGSAEVFAKPQSNVTLSVTWAETYDSINFFRALAPSDYTIDFEHLNAGKWVAFTGFEKFEVVDSFASSAASKVANDADLGFGLVSNADLIASFGSDLGIQDKNAAIRVTDLSVASTNADLVLEEPPFGASSITGYMRITLNQDFGHDDFVDIRTLRLIEAAKSFGVVSVTEEMKGDYNFGPEPAELPFEPYLPEIESININYESHAERLQTIWHINPFGAVARTAIGPLLDPTPFEGALYIGLADLDPPERLSLLFQVADGTGDPLLEAPELDATYLSADSWTAFAPRDIDDRTAHLSGSGMQLYAMPRAADPAQMVMPAGFHWLRIAAGVNAGAVNNILSINAQAMRATFVDQNNDPAFLETALPAGTIGKLKTPDRAIKSVVQPYASFGGRGREDLTAFHRRASERLRHKDRAVTLWDYEHIALEAFPKIYRVKTLNTTALQRQNGVVIGDNEIAPGHVTAVAVPFTNDNDPLDPLRPYTDRATLAALDATLRRRVSPFVQLETANPKFEEIHVEMDVTFRPEIADLDFYRDQLQTALITHLTPWRHPSAQGVEFGGIVYKSTIIDFVEELPYVDFLENVRMYHRPNPEDAAWTQVDAEIARAATARSVLVSAREHVIAVMS